MKADEFIREVDEELQREKLAALAKRYGWIAIAAAAALVLGTAGWVGWQRWQEHRRLTEAQRYAELERSLGDRGVETARALLSFAQEAGPGFATIARLQAAAATGGDALAVEALERIAADPSADRLLQDGAQLLLASRRIGHADPAELVRRLEPLATDGNPWRHLARQLQAAAHLEAGAREQAVLVLRRIADDPEAPAALRARVVELLDALGAPLARPIS